MRTNANDCERITREIDRLVDTNANEPRTFANMSVLDAGCLALARLRLAGGDVYRDAAGTPTLRNGAWLTPEHKALARQHRDAVLLALAHEARLGLTDWDEDTAYHAAAPATDVRLATHRHGHPQLQARAAAANRAFDQQSLVGWWRAVWALAAQAVVLAEATPTITRLADAA